MSSLLHRSDTHRIEEILASVAQPVSGYPTQATRGFTLWQTIRYSNLLGRWFDTAPALVLTHAEEVLEPYCSFKQSDALQGAALKILSIIGESAYISGFRSRHLDLALADQSDGLAEAEVLDALSLAHQQWGLWIKIVAEEHPELRPQLSALDPALQQAEEHLREYIFREAVLDGRAFRNFGGAE